MICNSRSSWIVIQYPVEGTSINLGARSLVVRSLADITGCSNGRFKPISESLERLLPQRTTGRCGSFTPIRIEAPA